MAEPTCATNLVIVHEQLTEFGGVERVLESISAAFPSAPIFGLAFEGKVHPRLAALPNPIVAEAVDGRRNPFRFVEWAERTAAWRLPSSELVLSLSQCGWSLAASAPAGARHVAYVSGVSRPVVWDSDAYLAALSAADRREAVAVLPAIRKRYGSLLARPDEIWTPSAWSARRIRDFAARSAAVVTPECPPVDQAVVEKPSGFVIVSRLVRHKDLDAAIEAFATESRSLTIVGTGADEDRLRGLAGPNVHFTGFIGDAERRARLAAAEGLLCPSVEEFGIAMIEALAAGRPVLAARAGAAEELLSPGVGCLIDVPVDAARIADALRTFDHRAFEHERCRRAAIAACSSRTIVGALGAALAR